MERVTSLNTGLAGIEDAIAALGRGEMIIVVDSPDRENEGDLVIAAEHATPAAINFMATHARGLICIPMLAERLEHLGVPEMAPGRSDHQGTAFHVGVDARETTTTGISASDRAATVSALLDPLTKPADLVAPGHLFPLAYRDGGVLQRAGHTEASVDLARLAGCEPAAVICEISRDDGEMARLPELLEFGKTHGLLTIAITDLIAYRRRTEQQVTRVSESAMPLAQGEFRAIAYRNAVDGREHVAMVMGDVEAQDDVLIRVHSECLTGDIFGSQRCDCGAQLQLALECIAREGRGAVVYLRGHEGRGIGLANKIHAYSLQEEGFDTVDANLQLGFPVDTRDYGVGMQILQDLGVRSLRLLSNNPAKRVGLEGYGMRVSERVPLITAPTAHNRGYLATKATRLGHQLEVARLA